MVESFDDEAWKSDPDDSDDVDEESSEEEEDSDEDANDSEYASTDQGSEEEEESSEEGSAEEEEAAIPADYQGNVWEEEVAAEEEKKDNRGMICAGLLCLICVILVVIAIILGVVLSKKNKNDENVPTRAPTQEPFLGATDARPVEPTTPSPTIRKTKSPTGMPTVSFEPSAAPVVPPSAAPSIAPTMAPTITPAPTKAVPPVLEIFPESDTYVYLNGYFQGEAFGTEESVLVQNGPSVIDFLDEQIPDAVALMTFDISELPEPWRLEGRTLTALLRLNHVPTELEREPRTYGVDRVPSTRLVVETYHGDLWRPPEEGVVYGPNFTVAISDTEVVVDITDLIFGQPPFNYTEDEEGGQRRHLEPFNPLDQVFLTITDRGEPTTVGGDRFYSRESMNETSSFLELYMLLPGETIPPYVLAPTIPPGIFNSTDSPETDSTEITNSTTTASPAPTPNLRASFAPTPFINVTTEDSENSTIILG